MTADTSIGSDMWERIYAKTPVISRTIAREYDGIDAEDIAQEIYLYAVANSASISKTTEKQAGIDALLERAGRIYAEKERQAYMFHSSTWVYTPKEVRALFEEAFFEQSMWENAPQKDDGTKISANNVVVFLWDMSQALDSLSHEDQLVIHKRFEYGEEYEDDAERKRCNRAIDKVTRYLNTKTYKEN